MAESLKWSLMMLKNLLIRCLLKLFRPWMGAYTGDRFLIVSTTALGDTLWGTPALHALRQSFPQAYISVLTSTTGKQVLQNNPHLDEIFSFKSNWSLIQHFLRLRKCKIATVLVFHTSQRLVLPFCSLLGASRIIGTEKMNKGLDSLLTERLSVSSVHEIERRLQVVHAAGANIHSRQMEIFPTDADCRIAERLLPSGLVIGIHPGAKDRFKQWPPSHFIRLGNVLREKLGCTVVVTGTSVERPLVETIARSIPDAVALYQGLTIPAFAAFVKRLALFITNDTGPLHIACAANTPTIALFTPTDPAVCGPYYAPHVHVVQKKPTCSPCLRKKCREPFCLLQISPAEVFDIAASMLRKSS